MSDFDIEKLLKQISELEAELKTAKKYGLVWDKENTKEDIVLECETHIPVLKIDSSKTLIKGKINNLIIEGDNYHALVALNYTYKGRVDIIYIDPPYNTGGDDFIYNDRYVNDDDGYRHSKWLQFMSKRLKLSVDLLKDNGIIFISIGDDELFNLKLLSDSIFGPQNFISCCPRIAKRTSNKGNYFKPTKDYVLVYAKNKSLIDWKFGASNKVQEKDFKYVDERGRYKKNGASLYQPSLDSRPNQRYFIECPDGSLIIPPGTVFPAEKKDGAFVKPLSNRDKCWRWSVQTYLQNKDKLMFTKASSTCPLIDSEGNPSKWNIYDKVYLDDKVDETLLPEDVIYDYVNSQGTKEVLDQGLNFSFAKPVGLIKYLIKLSKYPKDAVVLDYFAGSGTTGQAVLELNDEDGGNRRFILCTNNENKICEEVTYPRMKIVITGKRLDGSKYSDGIPANLFYLKTDFIKDEANTEQAKYNLVEKVDALLCIAENVFNEVERNDYSSHFACDNKHLFIYSDYYNVQKFEEFKSRVLLAKGEKIVYVYSSDNSVDDSLINHPNVVLKPIPSKIYEIYKEIVEDIKRGE